MKSGGGISHNDSATVAPLTIDNCTFSNNEAGTSGGGISSMTSGSAQLTVGHSTFSQNRAFAAGGAIHVDSMFEIASSTFSANEAGYNNPGVIGGGGALNIVDSDAPGTVVNSTFVDNNAGYNGGAVRNAGTTDFTNCTFWGNSAPDGEGGGIYHDSGVVDGKAASGVTTLKNTIVAGSFSGGNCGGIIGDAGSNISDDASCGLDTGDNTDPMLDSAGLVDNGGPTLTIGLVEGSPAIDGVADCTGIDSDQRGISRPAGTACDIGAFEAQFPEIDVQAKGASVPNGTGSVEFDTTVAGTPVSVAFTVENQGDSDLTLTEPIDVPSGFSVQSSFGSTLLAPGASTGFTIQLDATAGGTYAGNLSFANSDSNENPYTFEITGTVTEAEIDVQAKGASVPNGTGSVGFGATTEGAPVSVAFTVENQGDADLTLSEPIAVPNGFSVQSSFGSTTVAPGASTGFTIQLDATSLGTYTGNLSFANSDSDENPYTFAITGTVNAVPEAEIDVQAKGSSVPNGTGSVGFGATTAGTPVLVAFTVENQGDADLTLTEPIAVPNGFSVQSSFGSTLVAPDASTGFTIQLDATSAGTYTGNLSFANGDSNENPYTFEITGTVEAMQIDLEANGESIPNGTGSVEFGDTPAGTPVSVTFTVANQGGASLILTEPIEIPHGFSVQSSFGDTTLAPGASTTFSIQLDATAGGEYSGNVYFEDVGGNSFAFAVNGQVRAAPAIPTVTEWGMFVLLCILSIISVAKMRKRRSRWE